MASATKSFLADAGYGEQELDANSALMELDKGRTEGEGARAPSAWQRSPPEAPPSFRKCAVILSRQAGVGNAHAWRGLRGRAGLPLQDAPLSEPLRRPPFPGEATRCAHRLQQQQPL